MLSQVDLSYAFIINDFFGLAVGKHGAIVDDVGAIADAESFSHIVIRNQHADAAILEKTDDFLNIQHRYRVHPRERLVEQDEARSGGQGPGNFHAPPLPAREAHRGAREQVTDVEIVQQCVQLVADHVGIAVVELQHRLHVLADRQAPEDGGLLRQVGKAEPGAAVHRHVGEPRVVQVELAAVHRHQADHHVEAGGLARTVGPEQPDHLAAADPKGNVFHHDARAIALLQAIGAQLVRPHGGHGGRGRGRRSPARLVLDLI